MEFIIIWIFESAESVGIVPPPNGPCSGFSPPQTDGGVRPIGLYQTQCRIWAKARLSLAENWEASHTKGTGFATDAFRSPT